MNGGSRRPSDLPGHRPHVAWQSAEGNHAPLARGRAQSHPLENVPQALHLPCCIASTTMPWQDSTAGHANPYKLNLGLSNSGKVAGIPSTHLEGGQGLLAALACAQDLSGAPDPQVGFGHVEAAVVLLHDLRVLQQGKTLATACRKDDMHGPLLAF